jgi:hypothetical protein
MTPSGGSLLPTGYPALQHFIHARSGEARVALAAFPRPRSRAATRNGLDFGPIRRSLPYPESQGVPLLPAAAGVRAPRKSALGKEPRAELEERR